MNDIYINHRNKQRMKKKNIHLYHLTCIADHMLFFSVQNIPSSFHESLPAFGFLCSDKENLSKLTNNAFIDVCCCLLPFFIPVSKHAHSWDGREC